jgi:chemotaxis protein CheX
MKKEHIMPFVEAVQGAFKDFFKVTPTLGTPYLVRKEDTNWDISAIIGIAGESRGVVVLSISAEIATALATKLAGNTITTLDENVLDMLGEIVNIIAGNAKKGFEDIRLKISLPSIIKGKEHEIFWPKHDIPIISIPFTLPEGKIMLFVGLEKKLTADMFSDSNN